MIDTFDTATRTGVASDWDAKRAAQDRLHAELQPQNQAALFDALLAAGITFRVRMPDPEVVVETAAHGYETAMVETRRSTENETVAAEPPMAAAE